MPEDTMVAPNARLDAGPRPGPTMGGSWVQRHKGIVIGGGIAVVTVVGYLWYRSRQAANAAASAQAAAPTSSSAGMAGSATDTNTTGYGYYPYTGGYGGTMDMSTLASIMNSMEGQIASNSATSSTTTSPNFTSSGLVVGGTIGSGPNQFEQVPSVEQNQALYAAKIPQYEEVSPGDFLPIKATYTYKGKLGALPGGITPYTYIFNAPATSANPSQPAAA